MDLPNFINIMSDTILETLKKFAEAAGFGLAKSIPEIVGSIIGAVLSFLGVVFLILIIYGGFIWMTAGGNETKVERAKKIIVDATIGVIIVLSSYAITYFIIEALTKATGTY
jgi:TRAP-type C4-dicarboxylate transport system permease small subunit